MGISNFFGRLRFGGQGAGVLAPEWELGRRQLQWRQRAIHWRRTLGTWWLPIALVAVGGVLAGIASQYVLTYPKEVIGGLLGLAVLGFTLRRLQRGLFVLGFLSAPFAPKIASIKSLDVYPVEVLLVVLACVILVQVVFRARTFIWPALATIWPLIGLIILALLSSVVIQATWIQQVPHLMGSSPILYSELTGIAIYCMPLLIILVTAACIGHKEQRVTQLLTLFIWLAVIASAVILIEFRRIGADVYTFRYTEEAILYGQPAILFMSLGDLAQLVGLGAILAYTRLLYARDWLHRSLYGVALVLCLTSLYVTLENSRWLEVLVALAVITMIYSRRLFVLLCVCTLPLLPVILGVIHKIAVLKAADVSRLTIWTDMLRVWSMRPVLGVGPGNLWSYDQVFTHLPLLLRNFSLTGLGVAHNGPLQLLGELGPLGVLLEVAFAAIIVLAATRLFRRSPVGERRDDRMLAIICIGFLCGALVGDFVSGDLLIPPGQIGGFNDLPHVFLTWMLFACLLYKDRLWRLARGRAKSRIARVSDARADLGWRLGANPSPA